MDAATTSVSIIILLGILTGFILQDQLINPYTIIIMGVFASLLGFIKYNWYPSKMYMGDTGSQFLGIFLAVLGINFLWNHDSNIEIYGWTKQLTVVILFFIVPIIDTSTVVIKRISKGKSPLVGGNDHTTHHLSYLGLSDRQVIYTLGAIGVMSVSIGLYIQIYCHSWGILPLIFSSTYILIVFSTIFYISCKNNDKEQEL